MQEKKSNIPPEVWAKMRDPMIGLLMAGGGLGLTGGVLEGKSIKNTIADTLRGGAVGAIGGGLLGHALTKVAPLADQLLAGSAGGGLAGMAFRTPLRILSGLSKSIIPAVGGPTGAALLGAGILGMLGAALRGSGVKKDQQQRSIMHDLLLPTNQLKISSATQQASGGATMIDPAQRRATQAFFNRKYANILAHGGEGAALQEAPVTAQPQQQQSQQQQQPQPYDRPEYAGPSREDMRALATAQTLIHLKSQQEHELTRRRILAQQLAAPIGSQVGKMVGKAVSDWRGEKAVPGIKGFLGFKEKRLDPEKAQEVGGLVGTTAAGALAGKVVDHFGKNPRIDAYLDQLGI